MGANLAQGLIRAAVLLIPSYTAAYLTGEMVWVVPTLAASGVLASSIGSAADIKPVHVDEDGDDGDADGE